MGQWEIIIEDFDPITAGPKAWAGYARLFAINPNSSSDLQNFQLSTRENFKRKHTRCKLICDSTTPVLAIQCHVKEPATPPVIDFRGKIPAEDTPANPGTELPLLSSDVLSNVLFPHITSAIAQLMREQDSTATSFLTTTKDPALQQILKNLHGIVINQIQYFQLHKDVASQPNIDRWLDNKEIADGEFTVAMHDYVPEHLYTPVAALMTELMNDIIRNDNQQQFAETAAGLQRKMTLFRETGISMPLFLLSNPQGQLAGLSFVLIHPHSAIAEQQLTGITQKYRGRQLAFYLKALAIRETFRRHPRIEILETNCYSANLPIIHINQAMGYTLSESALQFRVSSRPSE